VINNRENGEKERRSKSGSNGWAGWTFVETLVVIAIVMILTGTVGFIAFRYIDQARRVSAQTQIETYGLALSSYFIDNLIYPAQDQGLEALWSKPNLDPIPQNWNGPYIDRQPESDPWGNPFIYEVPGPNGLPFAVISYGADGLPGGEGNDADISSWE
jgi:general secretion pathway protein G